MCTECRTRPPARQFFGGRSRSYVEPHVAGGVGTRQVNVPATRGTEAKAGAPFVSWSVEVAPAMGFGSEHERTDGSVRSSERDAKRAGSGHPPDDLELVARTRRNVSGPECQSPQRRVTTASLDLVLRTSRSKGRSGRARVARGHRPAASRARGLP